MEDNGNPCKGIDLGHKDQQSTKRSEYGVDATMAGEGIPREGWQGQSTRIHCNSIHLQANSIPAKKITIGIQNKCMMRGITKQ